jgi:hypothetical protein
MFHIVKNVCHNVRITTKFIQLPTSCLFVQLNASEQYYVSSHVWVKVKHIRFIIRDIPVNDASFVANRSL